MTDGTAVSVDEALTRAHREGWGQVLAATVHVARDLDLAEECVQEAYASAVTAWRRDGVPRNPVAWLTTAAKRRAVDAARRERVLRTKLPLLVERASDEPEPDAEPPGADGVRDERLRLLFLCCHPALAPEAQIALTLRLAGGMSTTDIARLLLVSDVAMSARLTRAKRKISLARIPYRVPTTEELPDRLGAVLAVVHLIFTAGHTAPSGASLSRPELADEAIRVARTLRELMPRQPEVGGLLALLLVTDARRRTRTDESGRPVRLADQDRSQWDRAAMAEAQALILDCLSEGRPGRFALQAAIASLHAEAPTFEDTDWAQIVQLYEHLLVVWPSPVVALNRAVAVAEAGAPARALAEVHHLERGGELQAYPYLHAVKAHLLQQLGRGVEAAAAYRRASELSANEVESRFLAELGERAEEGEDPRGVGCGRGGRTSGP
ncbi:MAG TPA: sigma-70 family RNA polymerase sigma factor [Propionibacteriaceae bacterium]|nr:sigma-70 family RNA polymerase sigma factor [Propionibacteriaceae bacterium]